MYFVKSLLTAYSSFSSVKTIRSDPAADPSQTPRLLDYCLLYRSSGCVPRTFALFFLNKEKLVPLAKVDDLDTVTHALIRINLQIHTSTVNTCVV